MYGNLIGRVKELILWVSIHLPRGREPRDFDWESIPGAPGKFWDLLKKVGRSPLVRDLPQALSDPIWGGNPSREVLDALLKALSDRRAALDKHLRDHQLRKYREMLGDLTSKKLWRKIASPGPPTPASFGQGNSRIFRQKWNVQRLDRSLVSNLL